ncbi:MAG TPA: hypothetical protein VLF89_06270 [Candidatus Saccharimonadales bacterium]|nr:hypothetical protein [Candidatus Saccharimonadales bacterium]
MKNINFLFRYKFYILIAAIILLAAILRLIYLPILPNAINGDELDYMLNAKAYFQTGKDIMGVTSPFSVLLFNYPPTGMPQAELPYLLLMPLVGPFPFSLFISRIIYALASVATVFLLFLISKKIFNLPTALFCAFIAAINPWYIFVGRTAYEAGLAVTFYLAGFYILLITKKWHILWSFPFFLLGFYSYIGTKLIFLPFILLCILYSFFVINKRKFTKQYLILFCISLFFVLSFLFLVRQHTGASRISEIYTPSSLDITAQVDEARKTSIITPLLPLYENKITVYFRILAIHFFDIFSTSYLFISGDTFFSLWKIGLFYYLDALFLLLGFIFLFIENKRQLLFIFLFILTGTIPQVFHEGLGNFTPHITLLFPFFILLIGTGIWHSILVIKRINKIWITSIIVATYFIFLLSFINIYFFEFPLQGYFDFPARVLSNYITQAQPSGRSIVIHTPSPKDAFKKYIYYSNGYSRNTAGAIKRAFETQHYILNNISFVGCSHTLSNDKITIFNTNCNITFPRKHLTIARLSDTGGVYQIYNDAMCKRYSLKPYPSKIALSDFSLETMNKEKFCQTYIFLYN